MRARLKHFGIGVLMVVSVTCQRFEPIPLLILKTSAVTGEVYSSCNVIGTLVHLGREGATQHGFVWSDMKDPNLENGFSIDLGATGSTGEFSGTLTELEFNTTYYLRSYAVDLNGTVYGDEVSFTTSIPQVAVVTTAFPSSITGNTAQSGGNVSGEGGEGVTARGVCWNTSTSPTVADDHTSDGSGTGSFSSSISGLECGTTYYVRAYATNAAGTSYGEPRELTTSACPAGLPKVSTSVATSITSNSALAGGNVTDEGTSSVLARGVCWSTSVTPTLADDYTDDGSGSGTFTSSLTGLTCGTTYYVRAYATNESGTSYGEQIEFTALACQYFLPVVTTGAVSNIQETSCEAGGTVTGDGGATVTARGVVWSTLQNPGLSDNKTEDGTGTGGFTSAISGLQCNTLYYVRAYATNVAGTAYGDEVSFTTAECPLSVPVVTTAAVTGIGESSATGGGEVTSDGGASVTVRGVCWSLAQDPALSDSHTEDGAGTGSFVSSIDGLSANTTYYVRAYATNSQGTGYGNQVSFFTGSEQVVDYDGNIYQTVVIGTQTWMKENLKVTHFPDGTAIDLVELNQFWGTLTATHKAYCYNNNNTSYGETFGALYTWAAAMNGTTSSDSDPSGVQGVCPDGWHLPSDNEWKVLEINLGMSQADADDVDWRGTDQGGRLKQEGTALWNTPNTGATNSSGFTALPGGSRYDYGAFNNVGNNTFFWSSTEYSMDDSYARSVSSSIAEIYRSNYGKSFGFSVRCVKD